MATPKMPRLSMSFRSTSSSNSFSSSGLSSISELSEAIPEAPESDDKICEMYEAILDHMLTAPALKQQLMESQKMDKKRQFVKMHKQLFSTGWGDAEVTLLNVIQKAKIPDIHSLATLKISLKAANKEFMNSFLEAGGVSILLRAIENRINKSPITELDIAILFEILSCLKAVMNNSTGMDGILSVPGSIDTIARSLNFDFKIYALLVLEILSVCCYYSDKAAMQVVDGMKHFGRAHREAPFASLCLAVLQQDIEVKASVVTFVNSMVMGVADITSRMLLRNDLNTQLFGERYDEALRSVEAELQALNEVNEERVASTPQGKLKRRSMIVIHGTKAYNEKKVESIIRNTTALASISEDGSISGTQIEVKSNKQSLFVNPLQGSMAGLLMAAKNTEKLESKVLDMFGGKKTKRRWYELDSESLKWCAGHEKEAEYKGSVSVSTITDIRPYTSDRSVMDSGAHAFEIETTDRVMSFGCETAGDRDSWVTALEACRDNYVMTKGAYKVLFRELTTRDVYQYTDMFKKQGSVYHSIAAEDKRAALASTGLDLSDSLSVGRFLQCETIAAGTNSKLLSIMHELLIIPGGSDGTWDAIAVGVRKLREASGRDAKTGEIVFKSMVDMANAKADSGGGAYSQLSKLALTTLASEQESQRLASQLKDLQEQLDRLTQEKANIEANITSLATEQAKAMAPIAAAVAPVTPTPAAALTPTGPPPMPPRALPPKALPPKAPRVPPPAPVESAPDGSVVPIAPSTSAATVDSRYAKYDKMRKMLPEGAVHQKMAADGFSETEIEQFLSGTLPAATLPSAPAAPITAPAAEAPASPAAVVDDRFAKYDTMRKMLPEGAVRQKMMSEGIDATTIDQYFAGELPPAAPAASAACTAPPAAAAVDPRFAKYVMMKKMLPEGAVIQKMSGDGFSAEEIDAFLKGGAPAAAAPAPAAPPAAAAPAAVVDPRFEKYDKMRKMLPEGAVRQKMMGDGFSADEIDRYFSGEVMTVAVASVAAAPAAVADPRFEKYDKMRKMLPEGAVRQKMMSDGFSADEIDRYFAGEVMTVAAAPAAPAAVADPRFEKYDKMRKMLPEGAVRQKMTGDGFTPQEIDRYFSGEVMMVATVAPAAAAQPAPRDPRFEKYDKMRKMLPEGAVRQKMSGDGFLPAEIENFFNPGSGGGATAAPTTPKPVAKPVPAAPVVELPPDGMKEKPKIKPAVKLKGIFWSKIKPAEIPGTVWHRLNDHKLSPEDTKRLEEWFAAKVAEPSAAEKAAAQAKAAAAASAPKVISVLDGKRTQNMLLIVGKLRRDPEGIVQLVIGLDPAQLTLEMTTMIFGILPTPEELVAIKEHDSAAQLDTASKVIFEFNKIPRLQQRMECHDIAFTWFNNANTLSNQFSVIQTACGELTKSLKPMETILAMILAIGNYINGDTARGQAYGVRLDIFMKLANLKAALPSQGSLMHYLALVAETHSVDLVTLPQQWTGISAAAEVSLKQIMTDFTQLELQVTKMNTEFTRIKDGKENPGYEGSMEDKNGKCTGPLHRRLDKFLKDARPRVVALKDLSKSVETTVEGVMSKYGESLKGLSEEDPCKKFFSLISTFGRQFGQAYDDNKTAREAAEKAARQQAESEAKKANAAGGGSGGASAGAAGGASADGASPKKKGAMDNIFGNFHKSQTASSDDVLEEFKRKMMARQQKG